MTDVRAELRRLMPATIADNAARGTWRYFAVRPMPVPPSWHPGQRVVGDCSKGVQYLCRWAGGPDPMRNNWGPFGNSSTLAAVLPHVDTPAALEVGDVVTFGPWGSDHAAMVLEPGPDPLLWSFGHQGAPNSYRLSADPRVRQLRRYPVGPLVVSPSDRLRAKVGYWSWLAWTLGEGDWRGWRPRNPTVRPNVPKRIPLAWWRARARFLAHRSAGH